MFLTQREVKRTTGNSLPSYGQKATENFFNPLHLPARTADKHRESISLHFHSVYSKILKINLVTLLYSSGAQKREVHQNHTTQQLLIRAK